MKYLGILKQPCEKLLKFKPVDISDLYSKLLNCTCVIYSSSSNYSTYDHISVLLRSISGAIIRQCSSHISLDEAFHGDVDCALGVLRECVGCGTEWKNSTTEPLLPSTDGLWGETVGERTLSPWILDDPSIFAETEAFMQRCDDLMDIYHGRIEFVTLLGGPKDGGDEGKPQFTGTNGIEVEQSLRGASAIFEMHIDRLKSLQYSIFDARASQWHYDFNISKVVMKVSIVTV